MVMRRLDAKVTPEVMQTMLLDEIAGRLRDMMEFQRDTVAEGGLDTPTMVITDEPTEVKLGRWLSMTITNDGTADVYMFFQRKRPGSLDSPIKSGETILIDQKRKVARPVYIVTSSGSATIRLWVLY